MRTFSPLSRLSMLLLGLLTANVMAQGPGVFFPGANVPGAGIPDAFGDPANSAQSFTTAIGPSFPGRMWFSYTGANEGLGYDTGGFFSIGGKTRLGTDLLDGRWLIEARAHLAHEQGQVFGNLGIERIFSIPPAKVDVGFNAFVDADGDQPRNFGHNFYALGVGGFLRHEDFEFRANGYVPIGTTAYRRGTPGNCFFQHYIIQQDGIDTALQGVDLEVTIRPWEWQMFQGHLDIGGYYYRDANFDLTGVESFGGVRVRGRVTTQRGVSIEAEYNYDEHFKATLIGRIVVSTAIFGQYSRLGQDLDRTIRNDHIVRYHQDLQYLIDPDTGNPYMVQHVDNTAGTGGNGTVETPYNTLVGAQNGSRTDDIIFVREGDGTTTGQDMGITLKDRQFLLGDGFRHLIPTVGGGAFELCNDIDGNKPCITGPDGGNVITLANANTVAGFKIDGGDPSANGIVGNNVTGGVTIRDNMFMNLTADGIRINTISGDIVVMGNMFENLGDDAVEITDINSFGNTIAFVGNSINNIGDDGIVIDDYRPENTWLFSGNTLTNIGTTTPLGGDGISLLNSKADTLGVGGTFTFVGNTLNTLTGFGINVTNFSDVESSFAFTMNSISNTGRAAMHLENASGPLVFTGNTFANTMGGFEFEINNGSTASVTLTNFSGGGAVINARNGSTINVIATNNIFENSIADGIQFNAIGATININTFSNNIARNNARYGTALIGGDDGVFVANFQDNMFLNNAQGGLFAQVIDNPATPHVPECNLTLTVGGAGKTGNLFDGNGGFGIGIELSGDANGAFNIQGNRIIRTVDDTNANFPNVPAFTSSPTYNGEGIHVRLAGANFLPNSTGGIKNLPNNTPSIIANNTVGSLTDATMGNASHGILVFAEDETTIPGLIVRGNAVGNNGGDGVRFVADDSAMVTGILVDSNRLVSNNNGLSISASQAATFNSTIAAGGGIIRNMITNNRVDGIDLFVAADGQLITDIGNALDPTSGNLIDGNAGNGIQTMENVNSPADLRSSRGNWSFNTITNNTLSGIDLSGGFGILGNPLLANSGQPLVVNDNIINGNMQFGINIPAAGRATFARNQITLNGAGGVNIAGVGAKHLTFTNNLIRQNTGHGMAIVNNNNGFLFPFTVVATGNTIEGNSRRGVNIFNQGTAVTNVNFQNNKIASNGEEGFYAVNTASTTQDPDAASNLPLAADGAITATPLLTLIVDNNRIINNGVNSMLTGTGFVLRVGTSDGGYSFQNVDGNFADNNDDGILDNGGVLATVTNNMLGGNFGSDVFIHSFVSTVNPNTTGGAWTDQNTNPRDFGNDTFNPQGYQGDPLARLDLLWFGNMFDSTAVNNVGAFYNNAEAVFKSRTGPNIGQGQDNNTDAPVGGGDDNGPFQSGTRQRNAQRLAARNVDVGGTQLPPNFNFGGSEDFLFPGVGQSTFRLLNGFDGTGGFIIDDPYIDIFDANGVSNGANRPEFMPYGWNFLGSPNPRPQ